MNSKFTNMQNCKCKTGENKNETKVIKEAIKINWAFLLSIQINIFWRKINI